MKIIVGLGNPGKKYEKTRHNIGWIVLDELGKKFFDAKWNESKKNKAMYINDFIDGQKLELIKPLTFMNESGYVVGKMINKHNIDIENDLIVVHDDKDIELGVVKVQQNRSAAGHNGVKSIIQHLRTQNFTRIRVGIASNKMNKQDTASFVLKKFGIFEHKKMREGVEKAVEEIVKLFKM